MTKFQKILLIIIAVFVFFLILISLFRFIFFPDEIGQAFRKKEPSIEQASAKQEKNDLSVFSAIGRLRLQTKDSYIIILSPYFFYPKEDIDFYQELATKKQKIRFLIIEYFSNKTIEELKNTKEIQIKNELIEILNETLVMGSIHELYFEEYIFLD